jgi:hypothetical protein
MLSRLLVVNADEAEAVLLEAEAAAMDEEPSGPPSSSAGGGAASAAGEPAAVMCVECEDQPMAGRCALCANDAYCEMCFFSIHRKGARRAHQLALLDGSLRDAGVEGPVARAGRRGAEERRPAGPDDAAGPGGGDGPGGGTRPGGGEDGREEGEDGREEGDGPQRRGAAFTRSEIEAYARTGLGASVPIDVIGAWFAERARYIPLRLSYEERKALHLVQAALNVSEYTDKVDVYASSKAKMRRVVEQIHDICAILCGLVVASDYRRGQQLVADRQFADNEKFFQQLFEIARRYKIMNPERMRTTYGKLMYLLQDSADPRIAEILEFRCVRPVRTVHAYLERLGALALLSDPLLMQATREILAEGKSRGQVQAEIRQKNHSLKILVSRYARPPDVPAEAIELCIHSIGDNNTFLRFNRDPCDQMIGFLSSMFGPAAGGRSGGAAFSEEFSLAITAGRGGARLTHSHETQYVYVLQTLTFWRELLNDLFKLWFMAEGDLLSETSPYMLRDTGQGLQRVQPAPLVSREVHKVLFDVQRRVGAWVGSSAVHLGDSNVPNALMFIDKYSQIQRILNPIVIVVQMIPKLAQGDPHVARYVDGAFGGPERAARVLLADFFRHGFDGSGSDNFFSAGSCVDGRSTSAWNWCSMLDKKPYYPLFKLCGFNSFDGAEWD